MTATIISINSRAHIGRSVDHAKDPAAGELASSAGATVHHVAFKIGPLPPSRALDTYPREDLTLRGSRRSTRGLEIRGVDTSLEPWASMVHCGASQADIAAVRNDLLATIADITSLRRDLDGTGS